VFLFACGGGGGKKVYFGNWKTGPMWKALSRFMKAENLIVEPATMWGE